MQSFGLAAIVIGLAVALSVGGVAGGRWLIRRHVAAFHNEVMISLFAAAGIVYAVLLGFLVVVVWESYDDAHRNVADEAATLVTLYRLTYGMDPAHGAELRGFIRDYTEAVATDEWPMLGTSRAGSERARRAIGNIDRQFAKMDPQIKVTDAQVDAQFLRTKSEIISDRNERLLEAIDAIPWVMWLGAVGGGVIVMVMGSFVYMERAWPHVLMTGLMGALIGLLLYIMMILSTPFAGPLAIGPDHFRTALQIMDDSDRGS
ncbi:MAG: bestrophin-like domain [Alphaproteobacteria bacterium]